MKKRILVIDDEDHIRRVMRMTLETAGCEVGEAADGPRGLEAFGDGSAWDVVLLDQRMPGMDGLETLRHIKQRRADARVIMITAFASIELAVDAMKLGATDFVRKPMTPELVRNAVTAALAKPAPSLVTALEPLPEQVPGPSRPSVTRLTLNGFFLWREPGALGAPALEPNKRYFMVRHPDGRDQRVVVEFAAGIVEYVARLTGRSLPIENSFWTWEAEHLLNNFLWNEGKVPPGGTLRIEKINPDDLQVATRWEGGRE